MSRPTEQPPRGVTRRNLAGGELPHLGYETFARFVQTNIHQDFVATFLGLEAPPSACILSGRRCAYRGRKQRKGPDGG